MTRFAEKKRSNGKKTVKPKEDMNISVECLFTNF